MIKSVTISPYESNSEIGVKSRSLVKDLSSCDNINNTNCSIYDRQVEVSGIQELPIENPDLCIQYVNYENFVKTKYTNVGIFEPTLKGVIEQENFLRLLDKIVVRSHSQKKTIPKPLRKNVLVARPTVAKAPRQSSMKHITKNTCFLTSSLGEYTNLEVVIRAYLSSFTSSDNVVLNVLSDSPQQLVSFINTIKEGINVFTKVDLYPTIAIYNDNSVYEKSNCFIDATMDYSISLPTMISASYATPIITCNHDGIFEWLDEKYCYLVKSSEGRRSSHLIGNIPNELHLAETMKRVVNNKKEFRNKQEMMIRSGYKSFYYKHNKSVGDVICSMC